MNKNAPVKIVTANEVEEHLGELLDDASEKHEHFVIQRDGIAIAVIIPMPDYERLVLADSTSTGEQILNADAQEVDADANLVEFLKKTHRQIPEVSEEEAERDIAEAIRMVRSKQ